VLKRSMKDRQLIMLMTTSEYNQGVRAVLASRDPLELQIDFDDSTGVASVREM
jgi:hypothetical protein